MNNLKIEELNDGSIIITKNVKFNPENKEEYLKMFEDKTDKGIIKEGANFFDNTWTIVIGGEEYNIVFMKELQLKKSAKLFKITTAEFELGYRSFLLYNLHKPRLTTRFSHYFKSIIDGKELGKGTHYKTLYILDEFLDYMSIPEESMTYFETILEEDYSDVIQTKPSKIPSFETIFLITDIVNDICENKKLTDYKDHLLFIMWWKICSVLPLRPSEFLATDYSCVYEEEDKFYLKVYRSKGKLHELELNANISRKDEYYKEDTVVIDESLFELIEEYQEILVKDFGYTEKIDLFPFDLVKNVIDNTSNARELNKNKIVTKDIISRIEAFYKYIISKEYGFETVYRYAKSKPDTGYVENISAKDLRHIAIINLVLLGCDVLDTMRLSGHSQVNTAMGYYNHVKEFSKGAALGYMNAIKNRKKIKTKDMDINNSPSIQTRVNRKVEEFNRVLGIVNGTKPIFTPVDGGTCYYSLLATDKSFCMLYEGEHELCPYFVANNNKNIKEKLKKVEEEVDANIRILQDLIMDMDKISKFNELYQTTSFKLSKNIRDMIHLNNELLREETDNG